MVTLTSLDENAEFRLLSAGMKRRVFLARALANDPDILLLDEPTNHLDITSILWLEDFLLKFDKTIIFVTHDRAFLQRMATRIVEVDRGRLLSFDCDYATYLERRQAMLECGREGLAGIRQEAGKGGDLGKAGDKGPPHTKRGPGSGSEEIAAGARAQAGAGRECPDRRPGGGPQRAARCRCRRRFALPMASTK